MKHTKRSFRDDLNDYEQLKLLAEALSFADVKADRRVQVKMPSMLVELLDQEFPDQDRSKIITQAALELLIRIKSLNNPKLEGWTNEEQRDLDRMWTYLEEREK